MIKKYVLAAAMLAALLFASGGCLAMKMAKSESQTPSPKDNVYTYMEKKYGEKFTYVRAAGPSMSFTSSGVILSCESMPGRDIYALTVKDGKTKKYYDNYMDHYFAGQVEEYIDDIAKDYFDDAKFTTSITEIQSKATMDLTTTFDVYIFYEKRFLIGHIDIGESDEEAMREFANELVRRGFHFFININVPSVDEGYLALYTSSNEELKFRRRK